jgi:hypothetical protein
VSHTTAAAYRRAGEVAVVESERPAVNADLTILARLALALARTQAMPRTA